MLSLGSPAHRAQCVECLTRPFIPGVLLRNGSTDCVTQRFKLAAAVGCVQRRCAEHRAVPWPSPENSAPPWRDLYKAAPPITYQRSLCSRAGVPNLQTLNWYLLQINRGIRLEIKCTIMHLNHPKTIPHTHPHTQSMEKLSSTKSIPGAKSIGDRCFRVWAHIYPFSVERISFPLLLDQTWYLPFKGLERLQAEGPLLGTDSKQSVTTAKHCKLFPRVIKK